LEPANEYTPIHLAAWKGNVNVMKFLLAHGADVNSKNGHGWTPLHLAAWTGSTEAVKFLLESRAQIQAVSTDDHLAAPHLAAWKGNLATLQCLFQACADIGNRCCKNGATLLRLAIQNHQLIAAGFLLDEIEGNIDIGIDMVDIRTHKYQFPTTPSI
jgi:ankyrin repeat protein